MDIKNENLIYQSGKISFTEIDTSRGKRVLLDLGIDAVLVVPKTSKGNFILTVQKRVGGNEEVYEFPSGGINEGESPEEAAERELLEEVGAKANLTFIAKVEPLSGLVKFNIHVFIATITDMSDEYLSPDENESVSFVEMSEVELMQKIKSLKIVDGYLMLGLSALSINDN